MKRITQAQRSKIDGFYVMSEAKTEEQKLTALRLLLGQTDKSINNLRVLEHLFIDRLVQHV